MFRSVLQLLDRCSGLKRAFIVRRWLPLTNLLPEATASFGLIDEPDVPKGKGNGIHFLFHHSAYLNNNEFIWWVQNLVQVSCLSFKQCVYKLLAVKLIKKERKKQTSGESEDWHSAAATSWQPSLATTCMSSEGTGKITQPRRSIIVL